MPTLMTKEFGQALGARIRHARIAAKVSQGALGEAIGVSFQQVQKYEIGKDRVSVETLARIAQAVGCSASSLLDDEPGVVQLPVPKVRERLQAAEALDRLAPDVRRRVMALIEALPPASADGEAAAARKVAVPPAADPLAA